MSKKSFKIVCCVNKTVGNAGLWAIVISINCKPYIHEVFMFF